MEVSIEYQTLLHPRLEYKSLGVNSQVEDQRAAAKQQRRLAWKTPTR